MSVTLKSNSSPILTSVGKIGANSSSGMPRHSTKLVSSVTRSLDMGLDAITECPTRSFHGPVHSGHLGLLADVLTQVHSERQLPVCMEAVVRRCSPGRLSFPLTFLRRLEASLHIRCLPYCLLIMLRLGRLWKLRLQMWTND